MSALHNRLWSLREMLELQAHSFLDILVRLSKFDEIAKNDPAWVFESKDNRERIVTDLNALIQHLNILDLRLATRKAISLTALMNIDSGKYTANSFANTFSMNLDELQERIIQSLEDTAVYVVPAAKAQYVKNQAASFGEEVQDKFADVSSDLAEAAICLGLSRNTACVFHLMRALEYAVKKLGKSQSVTVIDKNNKDLEWGKIIANVRDKVEALPKSDPKRDELSAIVSMLYHVKQAWRNSTMHPKQTYTDDEAAAVFSASKSFLESVAKAI